MRAASSIVHELDVVARRGDTERPATDPVVFARLLRKKPGPPSSRSAVTGATLRLRFVHLTT